MMSTGITFITIAIVVVLIFGGRKLLARFKVWTPKRIFLLLGSYIGLGLISCLGVALLSDNSKAKQLTEAEIQQHMDESVSFEQSILKGQLPEIPAEYKTEQIYNVTSGELVVELAENTYATRVYLTYRDDPQSNDVIVSYYKFPYILSGLDVTNEITPLKFSYDNSTLKVWEPSSELEYDTIDPQIKFIKFIQEYQDGSGISITYNHLIGNNMLHLNVPKHINIIENSGVISYLSN